jgi:hypothetical protein
MKAVVPESEKEEDEDEPHATGTEVAISSALATVPPDQRRTSLDGPAVGESAEADGTYGASAGVIDDTSRGAPSGPAAVSPLLSPPDPAEAMHEELSDLRNEVSRLRAELGAFRAEVLRRLPVSD